MFSPYVRKVHFYETDKMGIVHHSNYIRWFEEARVDFMDKAGFSYSELERCGIHSPILGAMCEYKSMVRFDEHVEIHIRITKLTGAKMTVSYRVLDAETKTLRAVGETKHGFLDAQGRPISLKQNPRAYAVFQDAVTAAPVSDVNF